ncbi:hypothetical protein Glove_196g119 [Diversispora epigaea]|uniref:TLDc domain-containing protein n=1 Tax=Diversispora epigaea TaxID=1348612 RepID=A0A397IQL4_9GLOM|nr:hypothetical protein Glove_196g119 [Diversispora epigaea]
MSTFPFGQKSNKMKNKTQNQEKIDPNDPFGIGLVPYHPDLITFEYTGKENLLLDFEEPPALKPTPCCFLNDNSNDNDDNDSFFEFLSDEETDYYECYNCKRQKYEEKKRRRGEVVVSNVSTQIFNVILQYIYGGIFNLENTETRFIYDLMYPNLIFDSDDFASLKESALVSLLKRDDLQMEEIKIWDYVIKLGIAQTSTLPTILDEWTKENFLTLKTTLQQCLPHIRYFQLSNIEIYDKIKPYKKILDKQLWEDINQHLSIPERPVKSTIFRNNFKKLENFYNDIVVKYPNLIFDSDDFASLKESALVSLLKRDDLQMEEIKIWDYVIKLGIAQTSTLPTILDEWTKENFLTLKTTLQQCLPHIRYFQLSNIEIYDKIKPYKKILDKQLWEDINQHLSIPERPVKSTILSPRIIFVTELPPNTNEPNEFFSNIISEDHAAEISILRGTKDGFAPQTFWNICHGHAPTVVVAKVKGTDEIIGGYNPLTWDNSNPPFSQWKITNDSFIFSLKNGNIQNSILSRVKDIQYAILDVCKNLQNVRGPYFGFGFCLRSNELNFNLDNNSYCNLTDSYYEKPIRTSIDKFSIDNYEVFKVVRKS